jgi:zinc protease
MSIRQAGRAILTFAFLLAANPAFLWAADPPNTVDPVAKAVAALYDGLRQETLPNGLRVYLKPIPNAPTVTVMTAYRVGSADEELDQTGLSHYLEHLMFKGTDKLMPGDIDKLTRRAGGQNNAYTTNDFTNFHFDMAGDRWETALEIEADRMRHLRIDEKHEFEQEKGAVIAELEGNEDEPWELENKAILPLLFGEKTPYGHPIIGVREHVRAATAKIIKSHYDKWYHPNNASLVVVGGFDPDKALARIKELFGPIPSEKLPPRKTVEPRERTAPVRKEIDSKFEVDRILMGFNTVKVGDPEDYVLDVIEQILTGGKTGRLYRKLVLEKEVAGEVKCSNQTGRYPGWFSIQLEVMKGTEPKKAEEALVAELRQIAEKPIDEAELQRARRNILASHIFAQEGVHELADSMVNAVAVVDLDYVKTFLTHINAVTAADVQRVAKKYLDPNSRVVVMSIAKDAGAPAARQTRRQADKQTSRQVGIAKLFRRRPGEKELKAGTGAQAVDLSKTRRVVLPNGLKLLLLERRRLPIVYAEAFVGKVRLYEPSDKCGVAALVGTLLEEGTATRQEKDIAFAIEDTGGQLMMLPSGGRLKMLTPDKTLGLSIMLDCLAHPSFPADSVKRLREHLLSEIEDAEQQPGTRAHEEFLDRVYGDHPLGRPPNGTADTVEKLSRDDCVQFHAKVFVPNNTTLVVVGDFDSESMVKEITDLTKDWKTRELPKLQLAQPEMPGRFVQKILPMENAVQVNLYLGHVGIRRDNPDFYKLLVMDNILGLGTGFTDRLSSKLRDRQGLAYTVSAAITSTAGEEPGTFSAFIATYPDKFPVVKTMLLEEIEKLRIEKPTDQEVADAETYLLGSLPFRLATNENLAEQMLAIERYGLGNDYLEKFRKEVAAVTAEDVQKVAAKYLDPKHMVLVAAGPIDERGRPLGKADK